jgi:hypothetical protein
MKIDEKAFAEANAQCRNTDASLREFVEAYEAARAPIAEQPERWRCKHGVWASDHCYGCEREAEQPKTEQTMGGPNEDIKNVCVSQTPPTTGQPDGLPSHASTGLNSFVTRLEKALSEQVRGCESTTVVNRRDLRDILYHFIRLDNEARTSTMRESGKLMDALKLLAPFELVSGDTIKRTSPHSTVNLNSNATWAVSADGKSAHKVREAIAVINEAITHIEDGES